MNLPAQKKILFGVAIIGGIIGAITGAIAIIAYQEHKTDIEAVKATTVISASNDKKNAAEAPKAVTENGNAAPHAKWPSDNMIYVSEWSRAIASIAALKLAISECLNDTAGDYIQCDEMTDTELGKYGVNSMPTLSEGTLVLGTVSLLTYSASIQISGGVPLGGCIFEFTPTVDTNSGIIKWQPSATGINSDSAPSGQTTTSCRDFVRGAR